MTHSRSTQDDPHFIGAVGDRAHGRVVAITGGVHGNEPAGVAAIERVLDAVDHHRTPIRGRLVGLRGNPVALARGERFIDSDLNRIWTEERLARAVEDPSTAGADMRAALALIDRFRHEFSAVGPHPDAMLIDLHSTSGDGPPFLVMADECRGFGAALDVGVPIVFGLEHQFGGSMLDWLRSRGYWGLAFEGGRNDDPQTVTCHEAIVWRTLLVTGIVDPDDLSPALAMHVRTAIETLAAQGEGLPRYLDVFYRHRIDATDGFRMEHGFRSFQAVDEGQLLAHDRNGPVVAHEPGVLLMPLYQRQGNDGFFLGRRLGAAPTRAG